MIFFQTRKIYKSHMCRNHQNGPKTEERVPGGKKMGADADS